MESRVLLDMTSFRPLTACEDARPFFEILENSGGIYVPEFIEQRRKARYQPGNYEWLADFWGPTGFRLERKQPVHVTTLLTIVPEVAREAGSTNDLAMWIPASCLASSDSLAKLVSLGERLYDFFCPTYGFIALPWLAVRGAGMQPQWGLPGFDWATWLGPEYGDLVSIPVTEDLIVKRMADEGRLFLCGSPRNATEEDASVVRAYEHVLRHVDPNVIQAPRANAFENLPGAERTKGRGKRYDFLAEIAKRVCTPERTLRLPKFRYLEGGVGRESPQERGAHEWGGYGPEGFTRTSEVRAILDGLEPDFLSPGVPNGMGGAVYFSGLSVAEAKRLLDLLPPAQADDALETSPTFREMVELGERLPSIRFIGYRTKPGYGERITIEGFYLSQEDATPEVVAAVKEYEPDEMECGIYEGQKIVLAKWG